MHRIRRLRHEDAGMTLVELLVAMSIFTVLLTIFGAGILSMTRSTARTTATAETTAEGRRAFLLIDKQVRSASAVNRAVRPSGTNRWYIEFLTDATGASAGVENPSTCTQWRLDADADTLATRTWVVGGPASQWRTVASYVTNDPTTQPPFTMVTTDVNHQRQSVVIDWQLRRGRAPATAVESTLVARNTTSRTVSNSDTNGDGLTERVCADQGQP